MISNIGSYDLVKDYFPLLLSSISIAISLYVFHMSRANDLYQLRMTFYDEFYKFVLQSHVSIYSGERDVFDSMALYEYAVKSKWLFGKDVSEFVLSFDNVDSASIRGDIHLRAENLLAVHEGVIQSFPGPFERYLDLSRSLFSRLIGGLHLFKVATK